MGHFDVGIIYGALCAGVTGRQSGDGIAVGVDV